MRETARQIRLEAEQREKAMLAEAERLEKTAEEASAALIAHETSDIPEPWKSVYVEALTAKNTDELDKHYVQLHRLVAGKWAFIFFYFAKFID